MAYPSIPAAGAALPSADLADLVFNPAYTYGEVIVAGQPLYQKASDSKVYKGDADILESVVNFVGFAIEGGNADTTHRVFGPGKLATGLSSLTPGTLYYLSNAVGTIGTSRGTYYLEVGIAISTTALLVRPALASGDSKNFGDGSDGAFALASGTTTWNTSLKYLYQFTSFALTGSGVLTVGANLKNQPLIVLVQGDLAITSNGNPAIQLTGFGAAGGAGGTGTGGAGADGTPGAQIVSYQSQGLGGTMGTSQGGGGGGGAGCNGNGVVGAGSGGTPGAGGKGTKVTNIVNFSKLLSLLSCGAGGGGGSSDNSASVGGAGGDGGGCIIFIVGGNINITAKMYANGNAGVAGTTSGSYYGGGGGGGGGGAIAVFYLGVVTANSATIQVAAGAGGSGGLTFPGGAGGAGYSVVQKINSKLYGV